MTLDWILSPYTLYATTGLGVLASMSLWVGAMTRLDTCDRKTAGVVSDVEVQIQLLSSQLEKLSSQEGPEPLLISPVPAGSINLTTRTQALRMHRRGEDVTSIAAALGVSFGEVDLLLKIDRLLGSREA